MGCQSERDVVSVLTKIEEIARRDDVGYIEACVIYCEENGVQEVESVAKIVKESPKMMRDVRQEAEDLHFVSRTTHTTNTVFKDT